jgi:hypothetical protein
VVALSPVTQESLRWISTRRSRMLAVCSSLRLGAQFPGSGYRTSYEPRRFRRRVRYRLRPRLTTTSTLPPLGSTVPARGLSESTRPVFTLFE